MIRAGLPRTILFSLCALLLTTTATRAGAQGTFEFSESVDDLLSGALQVHINARIIDQDQGETVWTMDVTRVTISGRSVTVRLDGSNVAVVAEFTPYWKEDGQLMLVAQGSTWVTDDSARGGRDHRTAFTTLPIQLGEPIVFLPLGGGEVPVDTERFGRLNIELEINVERYQS